MIKFIMFNELKIIILCKNFESFLFISDANKRAAIINAINNKTKREM
jgi:hypothetical protein